MKKKRKVAKKRLNTLLVLLLLTAVLLIMSTYAWFTANKTVNVDSIDVNVATSNGLQISADGNTWKTVLTREDLAGAKVNYPAATNQLPTDMAPVSSALNLVGGKMEMFYGDVAADLTDPDAPTYGEYVLKSLKQTDVESSGIGDDAGKYAKGYYVAFDVFIKSNSPAEDFYWSGSVVELKNQGDGTKVPITDPTQERGLANASRIALIKGESTTSEQVDTIQALAIDGPVMMWEPNADYHTARGVENATNLGWATLTPGNGNPTVKYSGISAAFTDGIMLKDATATQHADKFKDVTPQWTSQKNETPSMNLKDVTAAVDGGNALSSGVTKFRIYMWIEGQDVDCENYAANSDIEYNLSFSLDPF